MHKYEYIESDECAYGQECGIEVKIAFRPDELYGQKSCEVCDLEGVE